MRSMHINYSDLLQAQKVGNSDCSGFPADRNPNFCVRSTPPRRPQAYGPSPAPYNGGFFLTAGIGGESSDMYFPPAPFLLLLFFQLVEINSRFNFTPYARIGPQWLNELRRLWPSVQCRVACELVSLIGFCTMPEQHSQSTPTSLGQGCMRARACACVCACTFQDRLFASCLVCQSVF